jgi:hypothetical protein
MCLTGYMPGSRWVVSLPTRELRALSEIEGDLHGCAPRLVSMFAIFTRLTIDDGIPRTESLPHLSLAQRIWRRSRLAAEVAMAVPLALGIVALIVFLALTSASVHSCRADTSAAYVAAGSPVLACQTVQAVPKQP